MRRQPATGLLQMTVKPRKILVVDDNSMVCEALKLMLEFDEHFVETAAGGLEALAKMQAWHFDLVLTDYFMPGMSGAELADTIQKQNSSTPIIMLTASYPKDLLVKVERVLEKPCSLETLRKAIEQVLDLKQ